MSGEITTERRGAVLRVTIARPAKKNALTGAMYDGLREALEEADRDDAIAAVLLSGTAGVFTAGNDMADFLARAYAVGQSPAKRFIRTIAACDTPIVAAVEGHAVGIGTTMLFHCDLVYAAPSARFRMPFVDLGLVPEAASSLTVGLRAGLAKASEWLLLGEGFDAEEARACGLVNAVVPAEALMETAANSAERLAAKPREALRATRRLIRGDRDAILAQIDRENEAFAKALASPEAKAAFTAFLNRSR